MKPICISQRCKTSSFSVVSVTGIESVWCWSLRVYISSRGDCLFNRVFSGNSEPELCACDKVSSLDSQAPEYRLTWSHFKHESANVSYSFYLNKVRLCGKASVKSITVMRSCEPHRVGLASAVGWISFLFLFSDDSVIYCPHPVRFRERVSQWPHQSSSAVRSRWVSSSACQNPEEGSFLRLIREHGIVSPWFFCGETKAEISGCSSLWICPKTWGNKSCDLWLILSGRLKLQQITSVGSFRFLFASELQLVLLGMMFFCHIRFIHSFLLLLLLKHRCIKKNNLLKESLGLDSNTSTPEMERR